MLRKLIILFLFVMLFVVLVIPSISATWWNDSWTAKKPINISKSSGFTGLDYQVLINVTYDSDMNASFKDLRFTNSTDNLELDYWIERKVDSSWANVWVEVSENITTANQTLVYMYYGNAAVSSTSNGTATFPAFFDDFDDEDVSDWTLGGDYNFSAGRYDGSSFCVIRTGGGDYIYNKTISVTLDYSHATEVEFISKKIVVDGQELVARKSDNAVEYGMHGDPGNAKFQWRPENVWKTSTFAWETGTWYSVKMIYDRENSVNNNTIDDGTPYDNYTIGSLETIHNLMVLPFGGWGCFDNIKTRKYHYPEPVYSVGSEEVSDTCTCAGAGNDWEIDMSDYCNITEACDLTTGTLSFTGAGYCNCNASVDTTNLGDPGTSGVLYIQDSCLITID